MPAIVWVFVGTMAIGTESVQVAPDMQYAFTDKSTCERMIEGTNLKCIPLKLVVGRLL